MFYALLEHKGSNKQPRTTAASDEHADYHCPWDASQTLSLIELPTEQALRDCSLQDLICLAACARGETYRLRLASPIAPSSSEEAVPATGPRCMPHATRILVLYEQHLTAASKPLHFQDIPMLRGHVVDAAAADDDDDDDDNSLPGSTIQVLRGLIDSSVYQNQGKLLWLSSWPSTSQACDFVQSIDRSPGDHVSLIEVLRDETMPRERMMGKW